MPVRGQWYITAKAVRDYIRIRRWTDTEDSFARAEDDIIDMIKSAHFVALQDNGLERWRTGRRHGRLTLLVSIEIRKEGDLPQLVEITSVRKK